MFAQETTAAPMAFKKLFGPNPIFYSNHKVLRRTQASVDVILNVMLLHC